MSAGDEIDTIYNTMGRKGATRLWVLDADLAAAFDRINHARLLDALGEIPGRSTIRGWPRAGVVEEGRFIRVGSRPRVTT
ncbi:hypothetical protein AB0F96_10305 [Streptomyces sp. NPDC023998]|uniref:hypothetical protein n=1 Tax=Streptomyces sp. NPDC023998 TaxID=3154597 RepID=UPI0033E74AC8